MGAILRSPGAPPWHFRCRGAMLMVEDSLWIDGHGRAVATLQLVVVGEVSGVGGEIALAVPPRQLTSRRTIA